MKENIRLVALSDTHGQHKHVTVPDGDVLVYAGDLMTCGRKYTEVQDFAQWWNSQPHQHKVLVAGNHDRLFESHPANVLHLFKDTHYLIDSGCTIKGWNFWGSPVQPWFCDWAFNRHRGPDIQKHWNKIPYDTDILVTHGPPYGHGDQAWPEAVQYENSRILRPASEHLGCHDLMNMIKVVNPTINIFGHIHGGYGQSGYNESEADRLMLPRAEVKTKFYNVSICDEQYNPANEPTVIELAERE